MRTKKKNHARKIQSVSRALLLARRRRVAALLGPQLGVKAVPLPEQLRMRAALHDLTLVDHEDLVHVLDRAQPVRDGDGGAALLRVVQGLLDDLCGTKEDQINLGFMALVS